MKPSEFEKQLEDFNKKYSQFQSDFHKVVPFGRAGSDSEFRNVVWLFERFCSAWDSWYKQKKEGS